MVARGILLTMMGLQLRVPVEDLQNSDVASEAAELLPQEIAREHRLVPLGLEADSSLRLAVSHPHEREVSSQLASITGRRVRVVLALGGDIDELIERVYRSQIGSEPQPVVFYEGTVSITAQYTANLQMAVEFVGKHLDCGCCASPGSPLTTCRSCSVLESPWISRPSWKGCPASLRSIWFRRLIQAMVSQCWYVRLSEG